MVEIGKTPDKVNLFNSSQLSQVTQGTTHGTFTPPASIKWDSKQLDRLKWTMTPSMVLKPRDYGKSAFYEEYYLNARSIFSAIQPSGNREEKEGKATAYTFKMNDKVRITGTDPNGESPEGYTVGCTGTITYIYGDDSYDVANADDLDEGDYCVFPATSLQFVESAPDSPFKVGDKVKVQDPSCSFNGKTVTVVETTTDYVFFQEEELYPDKRSYKHSEHKKHFILISREEDTTMSEVTNDPVKAIMETELDADTRLLRSIGFEDNNGKVQDNGRAAVLQSLYRERREDFANKYRAALATEESAAKAASAKKA